MQFLIDADLPRSTTEVLTRYGHVGVDVREIGLGAAPDQQIAKHAKDHGLCLLTGDYDFSDLRAYPPSQYYGIIVLHVAPGATAATILSLLEEFLKQPGLLDGVSGKLAIVEPGRVRLRASLA